MKLNPRTPAATALVLPVAKECGIKRAFSEAAVIILVMYPLVATKDPAAVQVEVESAYRAIFFSGGDKAFVSRAFGWAIDCFTGRYADYQPVDARYHDFEHTLQGTLCLARLLQGRHEAGAQPRLTQRLFELGLLAILLHDSGYLKRKGDVEGTGAKYTATHVERGTQFAAVLLREKGLHEADIQLVQSMIQCTRMKIAPDQVSFPGELERIVGYAVGTADLLGQMAAEDYIDKLPALYLEFVEASRYGYAPAGAPEMFASAEDLIEKTPAFWKDCVQRKLSQDFGGLFRFLNQPYPAGPNPYLQRIEANMERLRQGNLEHIRFSEVRIPAPPTNAKARRRKEK